MDRLKKLDDERHRKLESLRKEDKDCADAVAWLRNNQDKFKMEVFEPPMLSCSVPDQRYTSAVEACFGFTQLRVGLCVARNFLSELMHLMQTIVAQCEEDYALLNRCLNDTGEAGLRKDGKVNTWFRPKLENTLLSPPMSPQEVLIHFILLSHDDGVTNDGVAEKPRI